jgi:hypothetical protein
MLEKRWKRKINYERIRMNKKEVGREWGSIMNEHGRI